MSKKQDLLNVFSFIADFLKEEIKEEIKNEVLTPTKTETNPIATVFDDMMSNVSTPRYVVPKDLFSNKEKLLVEGFIAAMVGNDKMEGSKSESNDEFVVTTTNGVTRTCDWDKLTALQSQLPPNMDPLVEMKPSLNLPSLRLAEKIAGAQFAAALADAITIKPKKVAVTFKRK